MPVAGPWLLFAATCQPVANDWLPTVAQLVPCVAGPALVRCAAGRRCFFREPSATVLAARAASNFAISSPIDALLTRHQPRGVVRVPPSRPFLSMYWTMRRDLPRMRAALSTPTVAAAASSLLGGSCFAVFRRRLRLRRAASGCRTRLPVVIGGRPRVGYQCCATSSHGETCVFRLPFSLFPASRALSVFFFPFEFYLLCTSVLVRCWLH